MGYGFRRALVEFFVNNRIVNDRNPIPRKSCNPCDLFGNPRGHGHDSIGPGQYPSVKQWQHPIPPASFGKRIITYTVMLRDYDTRPTPSSCGEACTHIVMAQICQQDIWCFSLQKLHLNGTNAVAVWRLERHDFHACRHCINERTNTTIQHECHLVAESD